MRAGHGAWHGDAPAIVGGCRLQPCEVVRVRIEVLDQVVGAGGVVPGGIALPAEEACSIACIFWIEVDGAGQQRLPQDAGGAELQPRLHVQAMGAQGRRHHVAEESALRVDLRRDNDGSRLCTGGSRSRRQQCHTASHNRGATGKPGYDLNTIY